MHHKATLRRVRVTILAVKKQQTLHTLCGCSNGYPARNAHAPYHIVICGLSGSTIFFHITSQAARFSRKKKLLNIVRRIQRDIALDVHSRHVQNPIFLLDFN